MSELYQPNSVYGKTLSDIKGRSKLPRPLIRFIKRSMKNDLNYFCPISEIRIEGMTERVYGKLEYSIRAVLLIRHENGDTTIKDIGEVLTTLEVMKSFFETK